VLQSHELLPLLVECCPGLRDRLIPDVDYWLNGDGTISYHRIAHVLIGLVADRFQAGDYSFSDSLFARIEQLLTDGSEEVQTLTATGILEGLQNRLPPELWVPLLGPKAREYLIAWDRFHGANTPGLEEPV
jgi:hypothetical protein